MRALCGSIITAGALIGLGLTAVAFGLRYQSMMERHPEDHTFGGILIGAPSLTIIMVTLIASILVGLGIAFVGLAYHHERRERERLARLGETTSPRVSA